MALDTTDYVQNCATPQYADLMRKIIRVESAGNPFAIGVVRARLRRQPVNLSEAVATIAALNAAKYNFSIGLAQINQIHFSRLGWVNRLADGFDICKNISAGTGILDNCFTKANKYNSQRNSREDYFGVQKMALSCYYSGDFFLGERLGYVAKVLDIPQSNDISQFQKSNTMDYSHDDK